MDRISLQTAGSPALPDVSAPATKQDSSGGAFLSSLKDAIAQVNSAQLQAGQAVDALMTGQSENVHQTMIALQKADTSFQLMMQVRNKLVAAYEEMQRMQI